MTLLAWLHAHAAERAGVYTDRDGKKHDWSVRYARTLIWDNAPYVPVGPWILVTNPFDEQAINLVKQSGLTDVVLELPRTPGHIPPQSVQDAVNECEKRGLSYLIAIGADPPKASGFQITPQFYRVPNIDAPGTQTIRIPGADTTFYALVDRIDASVVHSGRSVTQDGVFKIEVRPKTGAESVLLVYPHLRHGVLPDYWEGYDAHRDRLISLLRTVKFGAGLRGFVDPFGRQVEWVDPERDFVPDSRLFRAEFERYLRRNYPTMDRLNIAWSLSELDVREYGQASRLVPLYSRGRGTGYLWDPETDALFRIDPRSTRFWNDVKVIVREACVKRARHLVQAIKTHCADVPVVFTWNSWAPITDAQDAVGDGIGMVGRGRGIEIVEHTAAYALASISDWSPAGWLLGADLAAESILKPDYANVDSLHSALEWMRSLGAKGFFVRTSLTKDPLAWLAAFRQKIAADSLLPDTLTNAVFFPQTARPPADIMRLSPTTWWLPSHSAGERLDYGSKFDAYWIARPTGAIVCIWSRSDEQQVTFRMIEPKNVKAFTATGQVVETRTKKDTVTFLVGKDPVLVTGAGDTPVPEESIDETVENFARTLAIAGKLKIELADLRTLFEQSEATAGRSPGAGLAGMRRALAAAQARVAPYVWIEAETSPVHIFGDLPSVPAASGGQALRVFTTIDPPGGVYYARYEINVPVDGDYTLWASGYPPGDQGASPLEWIVDSTPINVVANANAVARYASRFGWFSLGSAKLVGGRHTLTVRVRPNPNGEYRALLDTMLLTPRPFVPDGIRRPPVD